MRTSHSGGKLQLLEEPQGEAQISDAKGEVDDTAHVDSRVAIFLV